LGWLLSIGTIVIRTVCGVTEVTVTSHGFPAASTGLSDASSATGASRAPTLAVATHSKVSLRLREIF
jgi:hypothetical protein